MKSAVKQKKTKLKQQKKVERRVLRQTNYRQRSKCESEARQRKVRATMMTQKLPRYNGIKREGETKNATKEMNKTGKNKNKT